MNRLHGLVVLRIALASIHPTTDQFWYNRRYGSWLAFEFDFGSVLCRDDDLLSCCRSDSSRLSFVSIAIGYPKGCDSSSSDLSSAKASDTISPVDRLEEQQMGGHNRVAELAEHAVVPFTAAETCMRWTSGHANTEQSLSPHQSSVAT